MIALAGAIGLAGLFLASFLVSRVRQLERRLESTEAALKSGPLALPTAGTPSGLAGLRVALAIRQDYPHPVFERLVRELLLSEDVAEILSLTLAEAEALRVDWTAGPEVLIAGELVGNGYAEVYYNADFTCFTREQAICTIVERPPSGDRPSNLALEVVTRLKAALEKHVNREARRKAIRELRFD